MVYRRLVSMNISSTACGEPRRDRTHQVRLIGIAGLFIPLVAVILRVWTRRYILRCKISPDDWTIVAAMVGYSVES